MESKLMSNFIDGMAKGVLYTLAGFILAVILLLLMFASPESKTKMVSEPCAVMVYTNI